MRWRLHLLRRALGGVVRVNASELTGEQAIANYLATGRTPIFEPYPLPIIGLTGCRAIAIGYWGADVACSCCGETKPRRWIDHQRGALGICHTCDQPLHPVPVAAGARCQAHQRWDACQPGGRRSA
jgi:hypothetical protein